MRLFRGRQYAELLKRAENAERDLSLVRSGKVLRYEPGDRIVFTTARQLSHDEVVRISETVASLFPGAESVLVDCGADLGVGR